MTALATLPALLARLEASRGARPFWIADEGTAGADRFAERARELAASIARRGAGPGDRVVLVLEPGLDQAAAVFACALAGAVSVIVSPLAKDRQVRHVVEDADPVLVVGSATRAAGLLDPVAALGSRAVALDRGAPWPALDRGGAAPAVAVEPGQPATLLYTSGSTGRPKGIVQSHRNLVDGARIVAGYLGLQPADSVLAVLPFSFDYGLNQLLGAAWAGCSVGARRYLTAADALQALEARRATVLAAVPPMWLELVAAAARSGGRLASLRVATSTGGRLPRVVAEAFLAQPRVRFFSMYGLTEAFRSSFVPPGELAARWRSIGRAVPEVELEVVAADGRRCADGEPGELVHAGAFVADGYWRDPAATARVFRPHPLRSDGGTAVFSGDVVRRDADGYLYFEGRRDGMLKLRGHRVAPDEIVDVLLEQPGVTMAAVVAVGGADEPRLVAHLVGDGDEERVRTAVRRELPAYMVPLEYRWHDALPRTAHGKVDVAALRDG